MYDIQLVHLLVYDIQWIFKMQGVMIKIYMDNFFSSPDLFGDLTSKKLNWFWTVKTNRKGMPQDLGPMWTQQKWSDIQETTRGQLTAIPWRKSETLMYWRIITMHQQKVFPVMNKEMLKNIHFRGLPSCKSRGYGRQDGQQLLHQPSHTRWMKEVFFRLLHLVVLNNYILLYSHGGKNIS